MVASVRRSQESPGPLATRREPVHGGSLSPSLAREGRERAWRLLTPLPSCTSTGFDLSLQIDAPSQLHIQRSKSPPLEVDAFKCATRSLNGSVPPTTLSRQGWREGAPMDGFTACRGRHRAVRRPPQQVHLQQTEPTPNSTVAVFASPFSQSENDVLLPFNSGDTRPISRRRLSQVFPVLRSSCN